MGNNGSVNLGIIGADWSPDGGGATILGIRVGCSGGRGLEVGLDGEGLYGEGLYAGARADIGICDGVSVSAGARAVAGQEGVGAAASAHAHVSSAGTNTVTSSNTELREAEDVLQVKQATEKKSNIAMEAAKKELVRAKVEVQMQAQIVNTKEEELVHMRTEKQKRGAEKTAMLSLQTETKHEHIKQSLSVEEFHRKMLRAMGKDETSPKALELQIQAKTSSECIAVLEKLIPEYAKRLTDLSTELLDLQKAVVSEKKKLDELQVNFKSAKAEVAKQQGKVEETNSQMAEASRNVKRVREDLATKEFERRVVSRAA